jgi:hypothetical protein
VATAVVVPVAVGLVVVVVLSVVVLRWRRRRSCSVRRAVNFELGDGAPDQRQDLHQELLVTGEK